MYGSEAVSSLPAEIERLGRAKAFIITGQTLSKKTGLVERVRRLLGPHCVGIFDRVEPHTPRRVVMQAVEEAKRVQPDVVVSIGGSSASDTAKAVTLVLAEGLVSAAELDGYKVQRGEDGRVTQRPIRGTTHPHIAIPTTLAGGEYTPMIGVLDEDRRSKDLFSDARLIVRTVILDPEMTFATPEWLWSSSGVKALDTFVEVAYSKDRTPLSDALVLRAIQLLASYLPQCHHDARNAQAKLMCQIGCWLGHASGLASGSVRPGVSTAIRHALGGAFGIPHGYCSCPILPRAMEFNLAYAESELAAVGEALGIHRSGLSTRQAARRAIDAVEHLVATLSLPRRLRELGVGEDALEEIAGRVLEELRLGVLDANPRPIEGKQFILELLKAAW